MQRQSLTHTTHTQARTHTRAHAHARARVPNATTSTARSVMHAFCLRSAEGDLSCAQNAAIAAAWSEEDAVAGEHLRPAQADDGADLVH